VVQSASQDTLVIQRQGAKNLHLEVDPQTTTVIMDGQPSSLSELPKGAAVSVSYRVQRGRAIADRIEMSNKSG
jgi:hypothetical protein